MFFFRFTNLSVNNESKRKWWISNHNAGYFALQNSPHLLITLIKLFIRRVLVVWTLFTVILLIWDYSSRPSYVIDNNENLPRHVTWSLDRPIFSVITRFYPTFDPINMMASFWDTWLITNNLTEARIWKSTRILEFLVDLPILCVLCVCETAASCSIKSFPNGRRPKLFEEEAAEPSKLYSNTNSNLDLEGSVSAKTACHVKSPTNNRSAREPPLPFY